MKLTNNQIRKIGKKLKVNFKKIPFEEFKKGIIEEFEHADIIGCDPILSAKIALAHLKEHPYYYTILELAFEKVKHLF